MPRKLPWLSEGPVPRATEGASPYLATSTTATGRARDSCPEDLVDDKLDPIAPQAPSRRKKAPVARTPSTSPPPAPPDVEYMREGYDADDGYMMVEDELWSTAKLFTQHLHHAEYERFKKLAASRGRHIVDGVARPVDGKTEQRVTLKMKMEAQERAKGIKAGIKDALGDNDVSSEDEDDFMRDAHLAGLMSGEANPSKRLSGLSKPQSNTRAAAGLAQSPQKVQRKQHTVHQPHSAGSPSMRSCEPALEDDSSTDDDDLDRKPYTGRGSALTRPSYANAKGHAIVEISEIRDKNQNLTPGDLVATKRRVHVQRDLDGLHDSKAENRSAFEDKTQAEWKEVGNYNERVSPSKHSTASDAANFLAKRRQDREKRERDEKRRMKSDIEVPTFAI